MAVDNSGAGPGGRQAQAQSQALAEEEDGGEAAVTPPGRQFLLPMRCAGPRRPPSTTTSPLVRLLRQVTVGLSGACQMVMALYRRVCVGGHKTMSLMDMLTILNVGRCQHPPILNHWRKILLVWSMIGLVLAGVVCWLLWDHDQGATKREFVLSCVSRAQVLEDRMQSNLYTAATLTGLIKTAMQFESQERFGNFLYQTDWTRPQVQAVYYIQKVLPAGRLPLERALNTTFRNRTDIDVYVPDPAQPEYAVVRYLPQQPAMNPATLLWDVYANPRLRSTLEQARDFGVPAYCAPDALGPGRVRAFVPIYKGPIPYPANATVGDRQRDIEGYIGCQFNVSTLFKSSLHAFTNRDDIHLQWYDVSNDPSMQEGLLMPAPPGSPTYASDHFRNGTSLVAPSRSHLPFSYSTKYTQGFRDYQVRCLNVGYSTWHRIGKVVPWPIAIILLFLLLAIIMGLIAKHQQALAHDIRRIGKQNMDLKEEASVQAKALDHAKSAFIASVSHEIRTPMNGMIGMTNLLMNTRLDATQLDYVKTAQASSNALIGLINQVLDFSKMEAGRMEIESVRFDLRSELNDVLSLFGDKTRQKKLELVGLVQEAVPTWLVGDVGKIRQILLNLIGNAVKFTREGSIFVSVWVAGVEEDAAPPQVGESTSSPLLRMVSQGKHGPSVIWLPDSITAGNDGSAVDIQRHGLSMRVGSPRNDEKVVLAFRECNMAAVDAMWKDNKRDHQHSLQIMFACEDTGIGIPLSVRTKLFEPFLQANTGANREYGGTGLGLSITSKLVTLLKGFMAVSSSPGVGSTFQFQVPLGLGYPDNKEDRLIIDAWASDEPGSANPPGSKIVIDKLRQTRALVVDTNPVRRESTWSCLSRTGIKASKAASIEEAEMLVQEAWESQSRLAPFWVVVVESQASGEDQIVELGRRLRGKERELIQQLGRLELKLAMIVVMVNQDNAAEARLKAAGYTGFLVRPLRQSVAAVLVGSLLGFVGDMALANDKATMGPSPVSSGGLERRSSSNVCEWLVGRRSLIVDDTLINRKVAGKVLETLGMTTESVGSGQEAIQLLDRDAFDKFDVIFMDIQMPEMDGYETTARIREMEMDRCAWSHGTEQPREMPTGSPMEVAESRSVLDYDHGTAKSLKLSATGTWAGSGCEDAAEAGSMRRLRGGDNGQGMRGAGADGQASCQPPLRHRCRIPIVAITADVMKGTRERCMAVGMDDYLAKPLDTKKLKLILSKLFLEPTNSTSCQY
eukprot:SM000001S04672  [mRNA]  locus=s1:1626334:1634372:+ [translate_table: standard]